MQKSNPKKKVFREQKQSRPGQEHKMHPEPDYFTDLPGSNKLMNKKAIITGGDCGIGRGVAIAFAKEGADVAIIYLNEHKDAKLTAAIIEKNFSRKCELFSCDISNEKNAPPPSLKPQKN